MSVRVVRTRAGDDVVCDLYEVTTKEDQDKVVGYQLKCPYNVWISTDTTQYLNEDQNEITAKITDPQIHFEPWAPLLKGENIMLKLDEVVTVYETHEEVLEKYNQLVEAQRGGDTDQTGPSETET